MRVFRQLAIGLLGVLCFGASALAVAAQEANDRAPEAAQVKPEKAPLVPPIRPGQHADALTQEHCHRITSNGRRCAPFDDYLRCLQAFGQPNDAPVRFSRCLAF